MGFIFIGHTRTACAPHAAAWHLLAAPGLKPEMGLLQLEVGLRDTHSPTCTDTLCRSETWSLA